MPYPFKDIPSKIYPNTFLKDVTLSICYVGEPNDKEIKESKEFFLEKFNLTDLKKNGEGKIPVSSEDGIIRFLFGASSVEVRIKYPGYRSFAQILEWIDIMTQYLQIQVCEGMSSVTISKFNELRYELNHDANADMRRIMSQVFSQELLTYHESSDLQDSENLEGLSRWERRIVMSDERTHSKISLDYGFFRDEKIQESPVKRGKLTLKSEINFEEENVMATGFKTVVLNKYNKILDNAFHWCMTPNIIKAMG